MVGSGHALYFQMTPLLGVLVGAAVTLLLIVMTVAVVVQRRNRIKRQRQIINNQSGESQQQQTTALNGPNQPLLPLPHALPGADPHHPAFGGGGNSSTGNAVISSSNGGHPKLDGGQHQRAVLLNKTGKCNGSGVNGQSSSHLNKLSHSSTPKGVTVMNGQYHQHQQDPDIILREMGKKTSSSWYDEWMLCQLRLRRLYLAYFFCI